MSYNPSTIRKFSTTGINASGSLALPAGSQILGINVFNTTANAITGGIKIGTSAGAADVYAALAVAGSGTAFITDALLLQKFFNGATTLFYDAVVSWNSASITLTIIYI